MKSLDEICRGLVAKGYNVEVIKVNLKRKLKEEHCKVSEDKQVC